VGLSPTGDPVFAQRTSPTRITGRPARSPVGDPSTIVALLLLALGGLALRRRQRGAKGEGSGWG